MGGHTEVRTVLQIFHYLRILYKIYLLTYVLTHLFLYTAPFNAESKSFGPKLKDEIVNDLNSSVNRKDS